MSSTDIEGEKPAAATTSTTAIIVSAITTGSENIEREKKRGRDRTNHYPTN